MSAPAYLFGGSFDPPHRGHQVLIEALVQNANSDGVKEIRIVPAAISPFKEDRRHAASHHRLQMLELMIREFKVGSEITVDEHTANTRQDERELPGKLKPRFFRAAGISIVIDPFEMEQGGLSYTFKTVQHLQSEGLDPVLVIGADNLFTLRKWKEHSYLLENLSILVFRREGQQEGVEQERQTLARQFDLRSLRVLDICPPGCSSTEIRRALQLKQSAQDFNATGESSNPIFQQAMDCLLPSVHTYILKHKLYQSPA